MMPALTSSEPCCSQRWRSSPVCAGANELAHETAAALQLPGVAGGDVRGSLDELGYAATLFTRALTTQADLVKALLGRDYFPVQMGELPHLQRPGDARLAELKAKKRKKRRWPR